MKKYNVAVVGATGMVGRPFLKVLEEIKLPEELNGAVDLGSSTGSEPVAQ